VPRVWENCRLARFPDRRRAGAELGARLRKELDDAPALVLGLPRGGVPVAAEVADALDLRLDVFVVRKLGVPGQRELAMGAIASGGVRVINGGVIDSLGLSDAVIDAVARDEQVELERRERAYRGDGAPIELAGQRVILVDDGLATGATMKAALAAVQANGAADVVIAVPTGARQTCAELAASGATVVCLSQPEPFYAVGLSYADFSETTDDEVRNLLRRRTRPDQTMR
jgi:putative phosphoribosyl transferase